MEITIDAKSKMEELFSSEQYCKDELLRIRESFSNKETFNATSIDASRYTLGFMLLYCPEHLYTLIEATLDELNRREMYLLFRS